MRRERHSGRAYRCDDIYRAKRAPIGTTHRRASLSPDVSMVSPETEAVEPSCPVAGRADRLHVACRLPRPPFAPIFGWHRVAFGGRCFNADIQYTKKGIAKLRIQLAQDLQESQLQWCQISNEFKTAIAYDFDDRDAQRKTHSFDEVDRDSCATRQDFLNLAARPTSRGAAQYLFDGATADVALAHFLAQRRAYLIGQS